MASAEPNLEWAKNYVAGLNEQQLAMLKQMYEQHRAAEELKERERAQQQEILNLLVSQKPVTVDVVRSSTSPESFTSSSEIVDGDITVKDVLLGKVKSTYRAAAPRSDVRPYRPRGSRERVYFEGHLFTFDKLSYDCKKRFFRCERKSSCSARIHCPIDSDRVIHRTQGHEHPPPTLHDLAIYDIDMSKVRSGHALQVNPIHNRSQVTSSRQIPRMQIKREVVPTAQATGETSGETVLADGEVREPVIIRLPKNFELSSGTEADEMEHALKLFLLQEASLVKELVATEGNLPMIFPPSSGNQLTLFIADQVDDVFHVVPVKARNEISIREAIENHFKLETKRSLMFNVAAKINVPLHQQMIDDWKTEEFIRVDTSKPNAWKIFRLTKVD